VRLVVVLVATALVLSACVARSAPPAKPAADAVSALKVTGQREQARADWAQLSPDGKNLLFVSSGGTCLRAVDSSTGWCFDSASPGNKLRAATAAWSPDGSKLAFIDEYEHGLEPDIRVLDVATAALADVTDDGVTSGTTNADGSLSFPAEALLDVYPSWSADGERIRFVRAEGNKVALMSVPAAGGTPTRLGELDTDWAGLRMVAWAEDTVAWVADKKEYGQVEVRMSDVSGDHVRTVLDGQYWTLSFSSDGAFLLADHYESVSGAATGLARVVPVAGGEPVPVADDGVSYPTWGPKGHAIAYVEGTNKIKMVEKPGAKPRVLFEDIGLAAADHSNLDWVPGALLVRVGPDLPVFLSLGG
jgi:Tol biopolymer transport system component